jgi:hypothetical protein
MSQGGDDLLRGSPRDKPRCLNHLSMHFRSWHIASPVIRQLSASCCQNIDAGRRRRGFEILSHDAMREGMGGQ